MVYLRIANWEKWQCYRKNRGLPPWIKVHRCVMRNPEFVSLTDAQRGQLILIWLLAADRDGLIPASPRVIARLCHMDTEPDLQLFTELRFIESGGEADAPWRQDGAKMAPSSRQHDAPEKRREEKRREEKTTSSKEEIDSTGNDDDDDETPDMAEVGPDDIPVAIIQACDAELGHGLMPRMKAENWARLFVKQTQSPEDACRVVKSFFAAIGAWHRGGLLTKPLGYAHSLLSDGRARDPTPPTNGKLPPVMPSREERERATREYQEQERIKREAWEREEQAKRRAR